MTDNKLQIHPTKSKHMFVESLYNIKNQIPNTPILINNAAVPRVTSFKWLGENLKWNNHIELIFSKVGAGIATIKRLKPCHPSLCKLLIML